MPVFLSYEARDKGILGNREGGDLNIDIVPLSPLYDLIASNDKNQATISVFKFYQSGGVG